MPSNFRYRFTNAINVKVTSCTEISMAAFDKQWKTYTKNVNFFGFYNVLGHKYDHGLLQLRSWYERILRSQFNHSADRYDRISLVHWIVEIGNKEDFIVDNNVVPFHAIIKTPIMEHWYSHANVDDNVLLAYIGESRRIPLFDEHKVIQPYYHSKCNCSVLDRCSTFKNCNKMIVRPIRQAVVTTECERLAQEVF